MSRNLMNRSDIGYRLYFKEVVFRFVKKVTRGKTKKYEETFRFNEIELSDPFTIVFRVHVELLLLYNINNNEP